MIANAENDQFPDFSLVQGGPVFHIFCRLGLCNNDLAPVYPRASIIAIVAWLPLFLLSLFEGHARSGGIEVPFLYDVTAHIRFLVALPALLGAETAAQQLISPRIRNFITRNIISTEELPKFKAAIESSHRFRDSVLLEVGMMVLVYSLGLWIWSSQVASVAPTWYASPDGVRMNLTLAGYWLVFVSVPLFQFFLLRWYVRIVNWFVFLLRVSRLRLELIAIHSDRAAGLGFLGQCAYGFSSVLFAEGALFSAFIANGVIHGGRTIMEYKLEAAAYVGLFLLMILGPLTVFAPAMIRAKWRALNLYGSLASIYTEGFDNKWIGGLNPEGEQLLGTSDIQSLADLSNSYAVLQSMRPVPFEVIDILWLFAATVVPLVPLLLFVFSIEELFDKLVQVLI